MILKRNALSLLATLLVFFACQRPEKQVYTPPNIIYILADDLGYGELGCYGQLKIETPNIDRLAREGMLFTQHYAGSPVCAPSRCNLLTGLHPGHAFVRDNHEWTSRGNVWDYLEVAKDAGLEGQYPLPDTSITIAHLLQQAGYITGMAGKWGLGAPHTNSIPNKMGFDYFIGYNCQRQAHTYYPLHLYENQQRIFLDNDTVKPHTGLGESDDPYEEASYAPFNLKTYAPDVMQEKVLAFIESNKEVPFFMYYATPLPHLPLQAPQKWVDYYVKKFGDEEPLVKASYYPHRSPRAAYAGMISYLDEQVGEIVGRLKALGIYENTLIIFTSDNGPTYLDADTRWFESASPFKTESGRTKGYLYEGGIRVPMIASWPASIRPGVTTDHLSAFWDVMPSLCDIARIKSPEYTDGISFLPLLQGSTQVEHDYLYWEFAGYHGQQAVRKGPWKAVRQHIHSGNLSLELYNLETDIRETHDVAAQQPEMLLQMEEIMRREHRASAIERFRFKAIDKENEIPQK